MTTHEIIAQKILDKLAAGTIPWRKPWNSRNGAVNYISQRPYSGINAMMLDPGEYATFNQIKEKGGKVKKGEKAHIVTFWKILSSKNEETGDIKEVPYLKYYNVFEINTQCEGLKSRRKNTVQPIEHNPIEQAEQIKKGYRDCPPITFAPGRAFYRPSTDSISLPNISDYNIAEEYYSTLFHEMVHSTGHVSRLKRGGILSIASFGSEIYSKEELVAEIGAAMLCGTAGIDNATLDNSAAYIKSWHHKLKEEPKWIVYATSQAQKAANYILGITKEVTEGYEKVYAGTMEN